MKIQDECETEPTKPAKYVNVNEEGRQWAVDRESEQCMQN